jgi:hypothetical protein
MTFDTSGRLGIGTSSPSYQLDVNGTGRFYGSSPSVIVNANNGTQATFQLTQSGVGNWLKYFRVSDSSLVEQFGGTDLLSLTTSGNLGLGTTPPSSTYSNRRTAYLGAIGTSIGGVSGGVNLEIRNNTYLNAAGNEILATTNGATIYVMLNGDHRWYTAPSGTAGSVASYTQALTLDNSGNLLLGTTTSAGAGLTVSSSKYIWSLGTYNNTTASSPNMTVGLAGDFQRSTSALKYKQNIRDLESIDITKFRPVRYNSKCENDDQTKDHFGIIADEVDQAGIKELVNYGSNGEVEGFQYERLTVVLLKTIQELKAEFDAYKATHP